MVLTPREVFLGAAALIEKHGWVQDTMGNLETGLCADAAICHMFGFPTAFEPTPYFQLRDRTVWYFLRRSDVHATTWTMFNDTKGMTRERVLDMLRWLADVVKEEEQDG